MLDGFELLHPTRAQDVLRYFDAASRRQGELLLGQSAVQGLTVEEPGLAYSARVRDGNIEHEVRVWDNEEAEEDEPGWGGACSCEQEFECPHIFAVMREVLAEHSASLVRKLSAIQTKPSPQQELAFAREAQTPTDLNTRLASALHRSLNEQERKFVGKLNTVYARCRQARQMTAWDFHELGLPIGSYGWNPVEVWPSLPTSEYEFWLYVAHTLQRHNRPIPDFMKGITDFQAIQELIQRWQRLQEIDRWKQTLGNLHLQAVPNLAATEATDLRLLVDQAEFRLQWKRPGVASFETLKSSHYQHLARQCEDGTIRLTEQADLIWQSVEHLFQYSAYYNCRYDDSQVQRVLGRVLRIKLLEDRIVTCTGQILARPAEPLRWQLSPATDADSDYRLRLVYPDGTPVEQILAVLAGSPTLYLTMDAIYAGPPKLTSFLDPCKETSIPAPALERPSGVALLNNLGIELPTRIQERVQTIPYEVTITCELQPSSTGGNGEDCVVTAIGRAGDGRTMSWGGYNWTEKTPKGTRKKVHSSDLITLYDSSALAQSSSLLQSLHLKPDYHGRGVSTRVTRKFPELFCNWLKTVPPHIHLELKGELASLASAEVAGRVTLDVTEAEVDWFDLRVVLDVADTTLSGDEIKLLLKAKGQFVRLSGKGWRRLHFDLTEQDNEHLAQLGVSPRELSAEPQRLHALQLAHEAAKRFIPEQQVVQLQRRAGEIKTRVAPDLPAGVVAELRPYQIEGFQFLAYLTANRFSGILADDMGLGKTLQTLTWLAWLRDQSSRAAQREVQQAPSGPEAPSPPQALPAKDLALVVCPKSVMDNWRVEANRFTPGLRVRVWSASELSGFKEQAASADLHVLNYSQLRTLGESLNAVAWKAVILDEGQYIKNPSSQTAQVARSLRAEHRLVLSGTPIENRLLDLWSLMAFAMPGLLGSRAHFAKLYDAKGDPFARRRLASRVRPFLLRRTKAQVAKDLPDRIEEDLFCEMEGEQKTLYRAELKRAQQLLLAVKTQKELAEQQFHFLVSLLRLRQICCDPRLRNPDSKAPSAKGEALLEQLEPLMEEGQKVLVFSQFVELLDLLRPVLTERNWPTYYLAGDTENRGELVRQFQSAEGAAVFLISLKAGGFGLNLTAASYVVLFDPWWNPAVENQAIDRTHRIGQTNKVIAYRLLIKDSIEEKIRELQKKKKGLAEEVLGEERFAQSLTLDDLRFLFAD
jgi:hypothetical protein